MCIDKLLAAQQQQSTTCVNRSWSLVLPFTMTWLKQNCSVAMLKTRFLSTFLSELSADVKLL
jgi:hypothetical protein